MLTGKRPLDTSSPVFSMPNTRSGRQPPGSSVRVAGIRKIPPDHHYLVTRHSKYPRRTPSTSQQIDCPAVVNQEPESKRQSADTYETNKLEGCTSANETTVTWGRNITQLPKELLERVFAFCAPLDLCHLNLTCRRFKENLSQHVWVSSLASAGVTHQKIYGRMICYIPRLTTYLKKKFVHAVPFPQSLRTSYNTRSKMRPVSSHTRSNKLRQLGHICKRRKTATNKLVRKPWPFPLNIENSLSEINILVGCWSNSKRLALCPKVCQAITSADKSAWEPASLSHTLDVLLKADQTSSIVIRAQAAVCHAITSADKSAWGPALLSHTLDLLLKVGQVNCNWMVRRAQRVVFQAITSADKSAWEPASFSHTLDVLLKADQTSSIVKDAQIAVCRASAWGDCALRSLPDDL